jgi:hypothetical protein
MHEIPALAANVAYFGRDDALTRAAEAAELYRPGREAVRACEATPPGPELLAAIEAARRLVLDVSSRISLVGCWERMRAWTDAETMAELAQAAGTPDAESDQWVIADTAMVCGLSEHVISTRFSLMRRVGEKLPASWEALHGGRITSAHLHALDAVVREATAQVAGAVEAGVLGKAIAKGWTPSQLRDAARRLLVRLDPDGVEERAAKAQRSRADVRYQPDEDMLAHLILTGDAWTTRRMFDEINTRADAMNRDGDQRSLGELRLAVAASAVLDAPSVAVTEAQVDPKPARTTGFVTLSLSTLLGGNEPGELAGYGPVTASMARRIAADGTLRRLVLDPLSGRPIDLGRKSYRLSREMRRWIDARDRTCRFRGCRASATRCDADHSKEWDAGGETTCDNCGLLCRRHHNFKTHKAWRMSRRFDDTVHWRSPHGFNWWVEAATYETESDEDEPNGIFCDDELIDDPDPPMADAPLPEPPQPVDDDEIEQDAWNRHWIDAWQRAG